MVSPLLMLGGAYLCFEGVEKLAERCLPGHARVQQHRKALSQALADPAVDLRAVEKDKIKGAVRTDFILSAEIIAITLGTVAGAPMVQQFTVLAGVALLMTVGVYGLVAAIVKIDDAGLWLSQQPEAAAANALGRGLLWAAPWLMKLLSVAGTAAMFLVGGGILVHGVPALAHAVEAWVAGLGGLAAALLPLVVDAVVGMVAGAVVLGVVTLVQRWRSGAASAA